MRTKTDAAVVSVVLPPVLAALVDDRRVLQRPLPEPATVGALLDTMAADFPVFGRRVRDETGAVRRYVNLFVDGTDIRGLDGAATPIRAGQELLIIQSVAGG